MVDPELGAGTAAPIPPAVRGRPPDRVGRRSVEITVAAWLVGNGVVIELAPGHLPFHQPLLHDAAPGGELMAANLAMLEVFVLIAVTFALTRRRPRPDIAARLPERRIAALETALTIGYGVAGLLGGFLLGRSLGYHPISFHLTGTLYGTSDVVSPVEVFTWAGYNFLVFAVGPYLYFRRRYSATQLGLRSADRRNDALVIVIVLVVESAAELIGLSSAIFGLSSGQLVRGIPLTFAVYFVGTVLPTMVFIQCILVPRYYRLTGSTTTAVILGGVTYTLVHCFDGWLAFDSVQATTLSIIFLFLQYLGPGMIKAVLTLRTGNAWVHVWAYHAIAPHVIADTPTVVRMFRL